MKSCTFWTDVSLPDVSTADEVKFTLFWFSLSDAQGWQRDKKTAKKSSRNCLNFCPWGSRRDPETPSVTQTSVLNAPADLHHLRRSRRLLGALEHLLPVGLVLDVFTPVANVCRLERMRRTRQHLKLRPNILYFLYFMLEPITFNLLGWSNWQKAKYVQTIKTKLIWKLNETKLTSK